MAQICDEGDGVSKREETVSGLMATNSEQDTATPLRVLCFDTHNTCARLFSKSLSNHLKLGRIDHPYVVAATLGPERIHTKVGNEQTQHLWETRVVAAPDRVKGLTYEQATNILLRDADKMEQKGRTLFVTEYAPFVMKHEVMLSALRSQETIVSKSSNPTIIPDELLEMFTPIIFLQHPAITIPAWLRLAKAEYGSYDIDHEDFTIWTSLRWSRILFDYLRSSVRSSRVDSAHSTQSAKFEPQVVATRPYVIDAADVANNPHATLATTCRLLGIDLSETSSSWTDYFGKAADAFKKAVPKSLMKVFNSNVLNAETGNIDMEHELVQWKAEFGDDAAELLRKMIDDDMQHYEYLKNFKIRISPSRTMTGFMQSITGVPNRRQSEAPSLTEKAVVNPLKVIRSAIDGQPRERHFSC